MEKVFPDMFKIFRDGSSMHYYMMVLGYELHIGTIEFVGDSIKVRGCDNEYLTAIGQEVFANDCRQAQEMLLYDLARRAQLPALLNEC